MKIGFSLGRCIRDIANGDVDIDDVAFIIAATRIEDEDGLKMVVEEYMYRGDYLSGQDEGKCQQIAANLWSSSKILQPRREGMYRHMQPESSIWVDMFPTVLSENESVKKAWDAYRFMIHMIENVDMESMEVFKR